MIFADGIHDLVTAYRVDDPVNHGCKQLVCGCCVQEPAATDPLKVLGHHKCEQCGSPYGREDAYERADELLARLCPIYSRRRTARLLNTKDDIRMSELSLRKGSE